jgi:hypothetical protein
VSDSIAGITAATATLTESLRGIHAVTREQAHGLSQVATAVQQMGQVTQNTAANAEEGAAASEVLHAQAHEALQAVVALERIVGSGQPGDHATRTFGHVTRSRRPPAQAPAVVRRTGTHG